MCKRLHTIPSTLLSYMQTFAYSLRNYNGNPNSRYDENMAFGICQQIFCKSDLRNSLPVNARPDFKPWACCPFLGAYQPSSPKSSALGCEQGTASPGFPVLRVQSGDTSTAIIRLRPHQPFRRRLVDIPQDSQIRLKPALACIIIQT